MSLFDYFLIPLFILLEVGLLPTLYQLQIKEYLWYRLVAKKNDEGLRLIPWKLPKKSIRNLLILIIATSFNVASLIAIYFSHQVDNIWKYGLILFLMMFLSKLYLILAMWITHPMVLFIRNRVVNNAKSKIVQYDNIFKIAVTGSYGKTSVKELLYSVAKEKYKVVKTLENHNSVIGVAMDIVSEIDNETEVFVCEIGAYRKNEIHDVTKYLKPDIGILTAIGNQHLELFGSKKNLIDTKMELYFDIKPGGRFYINKDMDDKDWSYIQELLKIREDIEIIKYSQNELDTEMYISDIKKVEDGFKFKAWLSQTTLDLEMKLKAKHNLFNLLPILDIASVFGKYNKKLLQKSLDNLVLDVKRLEIKNLFGNIILLDTYNSTYHGFMSALEQLSEYKGSKLVVTRGILELGSDKKNSYKNIKNKINDISAKLVTTDKSFDMEIVKEKDIINVVRKFMNDNKKYAILFEGRFAPKTINLLNELLDEN